MKEPFAPIGIMKTCFTEKFGVPRQSLMVSEARGILKLNPDPAYRSGLNHLEQFSHLWIVFIFHKHTQQGWRSTIRPPRIDAPRRVGVFASRSPHRPNPIGISAVQLDRIDLDAKGGIELHLSSVDILDGTPVLDIKPYLPVADCIPHANAGWAKGDIPRYPVTFSSQSLQVIESISQEEYPNIKLLITQMMEWDPRPVSQRRAMPIQSAHTQGRNFAFRVLGFDIRWQVLHQAIHVLDIGSVSTK